MDLDLPYKIQRAGVEETYKKCCYCFMKFIFEELVIAQMVQSKKFDGKEAVWFHNNCFFIKHSSVETSSIENFEKLCYQDQLIVLAKINPSAADKYSKIALKREAEKCSSYKNFGVEYATTGEEMCVTCDQKIDRLEPRIKSIVYNSHTAELFGKEVIWAHMTCFAFSREQHNYPWDGKLLEGFENLQPEDQVFIAENLPALVAHEEKRQRFCRSLQLCEEELEEKIATQTAELVRIREALVNVCEKEDLQLLLLINDCELSDPSMEELLDQCADILAFGSLYKCQKCLKGDMIFSKHGYTCNAWLDDWVKCGHFEVEPLRMKCTIPDDLKANPFFATCDPKSEDRAVRPIVIDLDSPTPSTSASPASNKRKPKTTKLLLKDGTVVDPKSKLQSTTHVYRKDKVLYSCVLGLTDIQKNKNSFYKLQVLESDYKHLNIGRSYYFFFSMGRTGTTIGSFSTRNFNSADLAVAEFEKLYQQTTGNDWNTRQNFKKVPGKFYPIDVNYGDEEVEDNNNIASRLDSRVQDLMKLLFNVNNMQITMNEFKLDLQKMPLGKLSGEQLKSAEAALEALEEAVCNRSPRLVLIGLSNKFFTLIPHSFGFEAAPVLDALAEINKKREMVESLHDIENAYAMMAKARKLPAMSSLDSYYSQLNASVEVLDQNSGIYRLIKTYVNNTSMHGFRLEILDIYKVQRFEEEKRSDQFKQLSNRQLLWHGSRITNFVSIIKNGLKISPQVHGSMFGRGIYFADMVSKSANYCQTSSSTEGLLALCEVALGNVHELYQAQNCQGPPPNYNSIKGVGQTQPNDTEVLTMQDGVAVPLGKPKAVVIPRVQQNTASSNVSSLQTFQNFLANRVPNARVPSLLYNEYIIYDDRRIKLQYLVKFKQI